MQSNWINDTKDKFCDVINQSYDLLSTFIASDIFIVIISTLVAAFAGAYGAQYIVERNRKKEVFLKEIRNTNAAIAVAFTISNSFLSLKQQHIKSIE